MAGKINSEWLEGARTNGIEGDSVEEWFARAGNWSRVEIDAEGSVWVEGASNGQWLDQDAIDEACAAIDRGV